MKKGTVKFYNESKGFGFITEEGTGKDYFVGSRGLTCKITEGNKVQFNLVSGPKGQNAVDVSLVQ